MPTYDDRQKHSNEEKENMKKYEKRCRKTTKK